MFKKKNEVLAILHQYADISTAYKQNKLDLNHSTCNCTNIYLLYYWYFQQNYCLNIKNMLYTTYIDYRGDPMLVGPPGNCPSCQCIKTALVKGER